MAAAIRGYRMRLIMPESASLERKQVMRAFGAELVEVSAEEGMEGARDLAQQMRENGEGVVLDQFANPDNPLAHYRGTGPELWRQTEGTITHLVSPWGPRERSWAAPPSSRRRIPTSRSWDCSPPRGPHPGHPALARGVPAQDLRAGTRGPRPGYHARRRRRPRCAPWPGRRGFFCGVSAGGAVAGALRVAREVENATIVAIICDRGDRYLSTGVFDGTC
jgi:cysteine synthase B